MKCPKCGTELKEGNLLCEVCGTEVTIVPEYESQVEQRIQETMEHITDDIDRQAEQEEAEQLRLERRKALIRRLLLVFAGVLIGVALVMTGFAVYRSRVRKTPSYLISQAYRAAADSNYEEAASFAQRAVSASHSFQPGYSLLLAEYLQRSGDVDQAVLVAENVLKAQESSNENTLDAYGRIVSALSSQERYEEISEILKDCKDENILDLYRDYLVEKPVVEAPSGTYEDSLYLSIEPQAGCIIRYTLDGTVPDESSEVYTEPVTLTTGVYTVWVNATNKFGVSSDVTRCAYKIVPSRPGLPVLKTPSGTYKNPEKIELEIPERGEIHYTTDGTDPTEESELYTEPIPMPDGVSTFKFAVISSEGVSGDIVEAHYNRKAETAVTSADGQNYIIVALIRSGEIVDVNGTIRDGSARFSYWLEGQHQIEGRGSFFIYSEMLTDLTGSSALTGRRFAVNAASGTVYHLEPGGNGEQLLLPVG